MRDLFTLELTANAYGGEALGRLDDGRVVFVPFAIPGETVRVRLVQEKPRFARAVLLEVLEPSTERIAPHCAHFGKCGGCHYQHLACETQLAAKTAILKEQLERTGGLVDPLILPAVPSPDTYYYRNYVQFHLSQDGKLGYRRAHSHEVLAIQECHLPETALNEVWPKLEFETMPELERIGIRLGYQGEVQLVLESSDPLPPELVVEELPVSVVHRSPAGSLVLAGSQAVTIQVLARPFRVSAGSFFQVNTRMAGAMVEHLLAAIPRFHPLTSNTILVDGYCGVGLFGAFLADKVGQLVGIESSPSAVEDFVTNLDEFDNVSIYEATVERVLGDLKLKPDVILVDPPREGIDRHALEVLINSRASLVIYVSCDPATLARDARNLIIGGYRLAQITPFDLFPQTFHLESISFWMHD
jgi:23S rRNA (uracil1939-C5)-methyltransferase